MCDGDFDGGFSDPDYDDLEFRLSNPSVYGHDEYMQELYGPAGKACQNGQMPKGNRQNESDSDFSEEYLQWKRDHPDRVAFFQSKSSKLNSDGESGNAFGCAIFLAMCIVFMLFYIDACSG